MCIGYLMILALYLFACKDIESSVPSISSEKSIVEGARVIDESRRYPNIVSLLMLDHSDPRWIEADKLFQDGLFLEAAERLLVLIDEEPDNVAAHSLLSSVFIQLGDLNQALVAGQRVVELKPTAWSYTNLGSLYILKSDFEPAKMQFLEAIKLDSKFYLALRNLGSVAYQEKNYVEAEGYFRQLIRVEPKDSYSYIALGQVLVDQGKLLAAKEVYQYRLQELEWYTQNDVRSASGFSLDLPLALAEVHRRLGETSEALRWLNRNLVLSQQYGGIFTSAIEYEDKTYDRLVEIWKTMPGPILLEEIETLRQGCSNHSKVSNSYCEQLESRILLVLTQP